MKLSADLEALVLGKAATATDFRAKLVADPRAAIGEGSSFEIPAGVEITILEETPGRLCLVLPAAPGDELPEAELSRVSGGLRARPLGPGESIMG